MKFFSAPVPPLGPNGSHRARARQDSSHLLLPMVYSQVLLLHELEEENRAVGVDLCISLANRPGPGLEVAKTPGGVYL